MKVIFLLILFHKAVFSFKKFQFPYLYDLPAHFEGFFVSFPIVKNFLYPSPYAHLWEELPPSLNKAPYLPWFDLRVKVFGFRKGIENWQR